MFIIKYKKIFLGISLFLVGLSLFSIFYYGLKKSIDFTGGVRVSLTYTKEAPTKESLEAALQGGGYELKSFIQKESETSLVFTDIPQDKREDLLSTLSLKGVHPFVENSYVLVGPSIGSELQKQSFISIFLVSLLIILYVAFAFRSVSKPVSSWVYGSLTITTLLHDIIIPVGVFAYLGETRGAEIDSLFIVALLTILGISISDTIVIFDRIRENLKKKISDSFDVVVGKSLDQSFTRSLNTSLTVLVVLIALYVFGPSTTSNFALVLIIGVVVGTYSSLFVASPLLTIIAKRFPAKEEENNK